MQNTSLHYDQNYFNLQKKTGIENATNIRGIFQPYILSNDVVLDFGCGGGFLLSALKCRIKKGFDVNKIALESALNNGIEVYTDLEDIVDNSIDVIISNNALEHINNPYEVLCKLKLKLKDRGKIIFRVPHETIGWDYKKNNFDYHLFTWSPMSIGNLFNECGYNVLEVKKEKKIKPPLNKILRFFPLLQFFISKIYRLFRILLEELKLRVCTCDGNSIVIAEKFEAKLNLK